MAVMNWITEARLAHEGASTPRPLCAVCDKPYAEHGSYPTCASHPYSPDGRCGHVGTFADGRFTGLPCMGAECKNGCVRAATLPHPALDRANAGERESEGDNTRAVHLTPDEISALMMDLSDHDGKDFEPECPSCTAFRKFAAAALPAADPERREGAEGVALPDAIEKLRRCTLGCGAFGQCKATMHGKPSECAGGVPIPHTFAPPDADTGDSMEGGKNG